jgi:hypothetical protein
MPDGSDFFFVDASTFEMCSGMIFPSTFSGDVPVIVDWSDDNGSRRVRIGPPVDKATVLKNDEFVVTAELNSMTLWLDSAPIVLDGGEVWRVHAFTPYAGVLERVSVICSSAE